MERIHQDLTPKMQTERVDDDMNVVAYVTLSLRRNGAMSITGNIADAKLTLGMLESAIESLKRHVPAEGLLVPATDLAIPEPIFPLGD